MLACPLADFHWRVTPHLTIRGSPSDRRLVLEWIPDASDEGRLTEAILAQAYALMEGGRSPLVAIATACTEILGA